MIYTINTQNTFYDEKKLFTKQMTFPVNFFYKLPYNVRIKYEQLYDNMLGYEYIMFIYGNKDIADSYMVHISPKKFKIIKHTTPKIEYSIFLNYYKLLQPVIKKIIETNNLYEKYPEYLI